MFLTKSNEPRGLHSYRKACKGDLHVRADEILLVSAEHVLEVGHDGGVHPRQPVRSVDPHQELGSLSLGCDADWNQQVPGICIECQTREQLVKILF